MRGRRWGLRLHGVEKHKDEGDGGTFVIVCFENCMLRNGGIVMRTFCS